MAGRPRHPNKEIEAAVAYAEAQGWTWHKVGGHAWGKLYCRHHDRDGCEHLHLVDAPGAGTSRPTNNASGRPLPAQRRGER